MEYMIVRRALRDLTKAGYEMYAVENDWPGEELTRNIRDDKESLLYLFNLDQEYVFVRKDGRDAGWVFFVFGEDGWDVICDYTVNLEDALAVTNGLSERLSNKPVDGFTCGYCGDDGEEKPSIFCPIHGPPEL
jgi:hypothetical protein